MNKRTTSHNQAHTRPFQVPWPIVCNPENVHPREISTLGSLLSVDFA